MGNGKCNKCSGDGKAANDDGAAATRATAPGSRTTMDPDVRRWVMMKNDEWVMRMNGMVTMMLMGE